MISHSALLKAQDFTKFDFGGDFNLSGFVNADFNGDGFVDVFTFDRNFSSSNESKVLLNTSDNDGISFEEKLQNEQFDVQGLAGVGDMDGDGDMDLVVSLGENLELNFLLNDGDGNFIAEALGFSGCKDYKVADFDGDDKLDLVGVNKDNDFIAVYWTLGSSSYQEFVQNHDGEDLQSFDIGDMTLDGMLDIVLGFDHFEGDQIILLINQSFTFTDVSIADENEFEDLMDIEIVDLNNDGNDDIVALQEDICVAFYSNGWPFFDRETLFSRTSEKSVYRSLTVGDFDGSGIKDIVVGTNEEGLFWHQITSLTPFESNFAEIGSLSPVFTILNADLDGDEDSDLIASNGDFYWFENLLPQTPNSTQNQITPEIIVYPNPTSDQISFKNLPEGKVRLKLYSIFGQLILNKKIENGEILPLQDLQSGFYNLEIALEDKNNLLINRRLFIE